ncbi:MAG: alpha-glucan family phosphorylase [Candidatus Sumerlaeota bacterium]|nr:alpha-glucan family phosphorylase [Candidatus Sumerlaeota bacterium]
MKPYPFFVTPNLPKELEPLRELSQNCWFSWNWQVVQLFIRMDPVLWENAYQNPVEMLSRMPQDKIDELAHDDSFVANLNRVYEMFQTYQKQKTWFMKEHGDMRASTIAYFSCEFGIAEGLPIYSGGLGILSGDHLKSASDLGIPLVAIGLLYQEGYFRQYLNNDGWQQERYPENDWYSMPVRIVANDKGEAVKIRGKLNGENLTAQVWVAQVGMTPLYLLDTNIPENPPHLRQITRSLYGGDRERRIQQELLLGVFGCRALKALNISPHVYHMNEGHSAFLALERLRVMMQEEKLTFKQAVEIIWASSVFTTHTPVPAGNERFSMDLMRKYVKLITDELGLNWNEFIGLGRINPYNEQEDFCMTVLALKLSALSNGVAKLHGTVSRRMWRDIWPGLPVDEVPIRHITNGIHTLTWISHDLRELLTSYLGPKLNEKPSDMTIWDRVDVIPDVEFWRTHQRRRERLVFFARKRLHAQIQNKGGRGQELELAQNILNPHALTLGFARRFATYKRGDLLFTDPDRLARILHNAERPVQIIFAGKAHPQDNPGKEMIKRIYHYANEERFRQHIVFLEDYDINVARYMVQGCDVWINNPRRPLEASGTSGMKAAANGVLNLSVMDGWWDEAYIPGETNAGWSIGHGEEYEDTKYQDFVEAQAFYDVLEREVIPLFYDRDRTGLPREWIQWSKSCLKTIARQFNTHRMLMEYTNQMYLPAIKQHEALTANNSQRAKDLAAWRARLMEQWPQVRVESVRLDNSVNRLKAGELLSVSIAVRLGSLSPRDVSVQLYHGPLNSNDLIVNGAYETAAPVESRDGAHLFRAILKCAASGRRGCAARIIPSHPDLVHPFMSNTVVWE